MSGYITAIGAANPPYKIAQTQTAKFIIDALQGQLDQAERKKIEKIFTNSGIDYRYSVIPDYGCKPADYIFYAPTKNLQPAPTVAQRMQLYKKFALPLALAAIDNCCDKNRKKLQHITHLITISCTGMHAPGLDIEIIKALNLSKHIHRSCINFMGCYAAINGLKLAKSICSADASACVLVLDIELCTLHFQNSKKADYLFANALFGDGAAAVIVEPESNAAICLDLDTFYCGLDLNGEQDMAWSIGDTGFEMRLSAYIPRLIKKNIGPLTNQLLTHLKKQIDDIHYFAIHCGGRRILEACETSLGLTKSHNRYGYEVLKHYGNMSSVTILFILEKIVQNLNADDHNKDILSFSFGPGITMEAMLLRTIVRNNSHETRTFSR